MLLAWVEPFQAAQGGPTRFLFAGIFCLIWVSSAFAQSAIEAVQTFGLLGTWSTDCSLDVKQGSTRDTYAVSSLGTITRTNVIAQKNIIITYNYEIKSAARVTSDKIKITQVQTAFAIGEYKGTPKNNLPTELVIGMKSAHIHVLSAHQMGQAHFDILNGIVCDPRALTEQCAPTGRPTYFLEKCL